MGRKSDTPEERGTARERERERETPQSCEQVSTEDREPHGSCEREHIWGNDRLSLRTSAQGHPQWAHNSRWSGALWVLPEGSHTSRPVVGEL